MKAYGGVDVFIQVFLAAALVEGECSTSRPGHFTPQRKSPQYPLRRRLGGPQNRSGQRGEEKILTLPRLELRPLGRPARSQSLYRLNRLAFLFLRK
jgi:hypothetical protein